MSRRSLPIVLVALALPSSNILGRQAESPATPQVLWKFEAGG